MLEKRYYYIFLLIVHAGLGYLSIQSPLLCKMWGIAVLIIGMYKTLANNNANNEAALYTAYWVGIEILLRMNHGSLTYESGKYGVIVLLIIGLFSEERPFRLPRHFLVYFLCLLPALTVIEFDDINRARKDVLFNFSGPMSLFVSGIYFYRRKFNKDQFNRLLLYFLLPIFSVAVVLFFKTPDLSDVTFTLNSNRKLSGGFGSNQVSTVLGLGIFIVSIAMFFNYRVTGYKIFDAILIGIFAFRGLLTFSRGGIIAAVGALFIALFIFAVNARNPQLVKRLSVSVFMVIVASVITFNYTDSLTGGFLKKRYANESTGGKSRDFTTGRLKIIFTELQEFKEYPILGAGLGMGKYERSKFGYHQSASHTEFSRLLAEHGLYGIIALLILIFSPLIYYLKINADTKPFVAAFTVLCFLTMTHGAMRLAMPGFLYGLIFIYLLTPKDDSLHREQAE